MSPSLVSRIRPFGVLVEAADREHALGVVHEVDDVAGDVALGRAGDADGLVERDVDRLGLLARLADAIAVEAYVVAVVDLRAEDRGLAVDGDPTFLDEGVGLAARAGATLAQVLVESHVG